MKLAKIKKVKEKKTNLYNILHYEFAFHSPDMLKA